jgi:hypothetical protein
MNNNLLGILGNIVAAVGIGVCAVAGVARILGSYYVMGFEAITLFIGGTALMVFAALIKLHIIKTHILSKG